MQEIDDADNQANGYDLSFLHRSDHNGQVDHRSGQQVGPAVLPVVGLRAAMVVVVLLHFAEL